MRLLPIVASALAILPGAMAAPVRKQVIVWFEGGAPQGVVDKTKQACLDAGGRVIHMYNMLSGFLASADEDAIDAIRLFATSADNSQYTLRIEDDQEVHAFGSS